MRHVAWFIFGVTVVIVAALAVVPGSASSYSCSGVPVARLLNPEPEHGSAEFFDTGAACNRDAVRRGWAMAGAAVMGLGAAAALGFGARRRTTEADGVRGAGGDPVRSVW